MSPTSGLTFLMRKPLMRRQRACRMSARRCSRAIFSPLIDFAIELAEALNSCGAVGRSAPYNPIGVYGIAMDARHLSPKGRSARPCRSPALVVVVVVLLLAGTASARCGLPLFESHAAAVSHPLLTSQGTEFAAGVDHAQVYHGSTSPCPAKFATAVLPRSATASAPFGAVVAVVAVAGVFSDLVAPAGRSPPARLVPPLGGQALLTRLCVARR